VALSSLWWAAEGQPPWLAVANSRVLNAWRSYFALQVWRETPPLASESRVLFVAVPHGLFPMAVPLLSGAVFERVFPELSRRKPRAAVASVFFWIPLLAPLVRWLGGVPATRTIIEKHLSAPGSSCLLVPDGIAGAYSSPDLTAARVEVLRIGGRTRFEELARSLDVTIVPVYCFGHSQLWQWSWPPHGHWLARLSRRLRMALIWYWPVIPAVTKGGLKVVFGPPLANDESFATAIAQLYARHADQDERRPLHIAH